MDYEKEIKELKRQMRLLQESYLQLSKNQVPVTAKADDAINKADAVTPYLESRQAYIGNTECVFDKAKDGNISAWLVTDKEQIPCDFEVKNGKIRVTFEPLEKVAIVNISIQ